MLVPEIAFRHASPICQLVHDLEKKLNIFLTNGHLYAGSVSIPTICRVQCPLYVYFDYQIHYNSSWLEYDKSTARNYSRS